MVVKKLCATFASTISKKELSIKFDDFMRSKKMYTGWDDIMTVNEFIKNGFLEDRRSWEHG